MRRIGALFLISAACTTSFETADLASQGAGEIQSDTDIFFTAGTVDQSDPAPAECNNLPCDSFEFEVNLPTGTFSSGTPGGVQVAVRWLTSMADTVDLYVYDDNGALVAESTGIISQGQSLTIPSAPNGDYTAYVVYNPGLIGSPSVAWEALVEVEFDPKPAPPRQLLPDLIMRQTDVVTFDTPFFPLFGWPQPEPGHSCWPTEEAEGATVCMRFDMFTANRGEGALEMALRLPNDPNDPSNDVFQRIYRTDGGRDVRQAGTWEFHTEHGHYHFNEFAQAFLYSGDASGNITNSTPVRTGDKVSFGIIDVRIDAWGEKGDGPRHYKGPFVLFPSEFDDLYSYIIQGITRGWGDLYDWDLPDQMIEVSGLPDGYYVLHSVTDPGNGVKESDETNNCAAMLIYLQDVDTESRSATLIGPAAQPTCQ